MLPLNANAMVERLVPLADGSIQIDRDKRELYLNLTVEGGAFFGNGRYPTNAY